MKDYIKVLDISLTVGNSKSELTEYSEIMINYSVKKLKISIINAEYNGNKSAALFIFDDNRYEWKCIAEISFLDMIVCKIPYQESNEKKHFKEDINRLHEKALLILIRRVSSPVTGVKGKNIKLVNQGQRKQLRSGAGTSIKRKNNETKMQCL